MGLDELDKLGELGIGVLMGIALILALLNAWRFLGGSFRERTITLEALKESVTALAAHSVVLKSLDDKVDDLQKQNAASFDNARLTMSDVTVRRDKEYKAGVDDIKDKIDVSSDDIKAKIEVVPTEVGKVTESQIDTIRKALAEMEERVGRRIDDAIGKTSEVQIELIRSEIKAFSKQILEKLEALEDVVPEKVIRKIQSVESQAADSAVVTEGVSPKE